jgi:membrane-bound metal-dependent hydrolase YbcI (DUF457 family)
MANFNTHVGVATGAVTVAVAVTVYWQWITLAQAPWYIAMGVVGGMLPDIDADNSKPVRRLFTFLALVGGLMLWRLFGSCLQDEVLMGLCIIGYLTIRYGLFFLFQKLTIHRGVFHSLLAVIFFGLAATCISYYSLGWEEVNAWYSGLFLALGVIVHLCLDELFSVDLNNGRMKKSFGTALKLFNYKSLSASLLMLILVLILFLSAPSTAYLFAEWEKKPILNIDWSYQSLDLPTCNTTTRYGKNSRFK